MENGQDSFFDALNLNPLFSMKKQFLIGKITLFPKSVCGKFSKLCMFLLPFEKLLTKSQEEESQRDWLKRVPSFVGVLQILLTSEVK